MTILITGFGPFPGAPFNPTEPLVRELARRRFPIGARRVAHVFRVAYDVVDRELPELIARERPTALIMFGLAGRTRHLRIETQAHNARSRVHPDVSGFMPVTTAILPAAPATLPLRVPARRLVDAARATGVPAMLSRDPGRYLCNYLCWRAAEAARDRGLRLAAFVHVPPVPPIVIRPPPRGRLTLDDLITAGEAIVRAAVATALIGAPPRGFQRTSPLTLTA
jgi:pyroglutamyl-peptidase